MSLVNSAKFIVATNPNINILLRGTGLDVKSVLQKYGSDEEAAAHKKAAQEALDAESKQAADAESEDVKEMNTLLMKQQIRALSLKEKVRLRQLQDAQNHSASHDADGDKNDKRSQKDKNILISAFGLGDLSLLDDDHTQQDDDAMANAAMASQAVQLLWLTHNIRKLILAYTPEGYDTAKLYAKRSRDGVDVANAVTLGNPAVDMYDNTAPGEDNSQASSRAVTRPTTSKATGMPTVHRSASVSSSKWTASAALANKPRPDGVVVPSSGQSSSDALINAFRRQRVRVQGGDVLGDGQDGNVSDASRPNSATNSDVSDSTSTAGDYSISEFSDAASPQPARSRRQRARDTRLTTDWLETARARQLLNTLVAERLRMYSVDPAEQDENILGKNMAPLKDEIDPAIYQQVLAAIQARNRVESMKERTQENKPSETSAIDNETRDGTSTQPKPNPDPSQRSPRSPPTLPKSPSMVLANADTSSPSATPGGVHHRRVPRSFYRVFALGDTVVQSPKNATPKKLDTKMVDSTSGKVTFSPTRASQSPQKPPSPRKVSMIDTSHTAADRSPQLSTLTVNTNVQTPHSYSAVSSALQTPESATPDAIVVPLAPQSSQNTDMSIHAAQTNVLASNASVDPHNKSWDPQQATPTSATQDASPNTPSRSRATTPNGAQSPQTPIPNFAGSTLSLPTAQHLSNRRRSSVSLSAELRNSSYPRSRPPSGAPTLFFDPANDPLRRVFTPRPSKPPGTSTTPTASDAEQGFVQPPSATNTAGSTRKLIRRVSQTGLLTHRGSFSPISPFPSKPFFNGASQPLTTTHAASELDHARDPRHRASIVMFQSSDFTPAAVDVQELMRLKRERERAGDTRAFGLIDDAVQRAAATDAAEEAERVSMNVSKPVGLPADADTAVSLEDRSSKENRSFKDLDVESASATPALLSPVGHDPAAIQKVRFLDGPTPRSATSTSPSNAGKIGEKTGDNSSNGDHSDKMPVDANESLSLVEAARMAVALRPLQNPNVHSVITVALTHALDALLEVSFSSYSCCRSHFRVVIIL